MESEFLSVFKKTSSGLWQRNGFMNKLEKNDIKIEEEEGEMGSASTATTVQLPLY